MSCRTFQSNPSEHAIIALWPTARDDYPDDVKTPIPCHVCGKLGWVYFDQGTIEELQPAFFECVYHEHLTPTREFTQGA